MRTNGHDVFERARGAAGQNMEYRVDAHEGPSVRQMTLSNWYSARARLVVMTDKDGWLHYADSLFVFQADDFEGALQRALELGRGQEKEYLNEEGDKVSWRLKEILTLNKIRGESMDGAEVHYESAEIPVADRRLQESGAFNPELSKPEQTF